MAEESVEALQAKVSALEERIKVLEEAVKPENLNKVISRRQSSLGV